MKIKLPLYAKILFWFFLNLVFLCVIFLVVARVQFKFGLDSLVAGPAGKNVQQVIQLLTAELRENANDNWNGALSRFGETYHVKFYLFRGPEQEAGVPVELPKEVRDRMPDHRPFNNAPGGNNFPPPRRDDNGPDARPGFGPPGQVDPEVIGQQERPPQKSMVHTTSPSRYWVVTPVVLPNREGPMRLPGRTNDHD